MNTKTDSQPSDSTEAKQRGGGDCVSRLARPSITSEQRSEFRQWSKALAGLSDADKESEAEAWIASALGILGKTNANVDAQIPAPQDSESKTD
jgi:hypothetical protein